MNLRARAKIVTIFLPYSCMWRWLLPALRSDNGTLGNSPNRWPQPSSVNPRLEGVYEMGSTQAPFDAATNTYNTYNSVNVTTSGGPIAGANYAFTNVAGWTTP